MLSSTLNDASDATTVEAPPTDNATCMKTNLTTGSTVHIHASNYCNQQGVRTESIDGIDSVGFLDQGDWLSYSISVEEEDAYIVRFRVASLDGDGGFALSVGDQVVLEMNEVPKTDGWYSWTTLSQRTTLPAGESNLTLSVLDSGWNLQWIEFDQYVVGETCHLFSLPTESNTIRIPAQDYCTQYGTEIGTHGGVENVGYLDVRDWMQWDILVRDGSYNVSLRVASPDGDGGFNVSTNQALLWSQRGLPASGGWYEWETIEFQANLASMDDQLSIDVTGVGWNLLWIELKLLESDDDSVGSAFSSTLVAGKHASIAKFVHAEGTEIIGPNGHPLLLKGMGLGGWMLQEPYMMLDDAQGQWQMYQRVSDLIGPDNFKLYRTSWLDNWFTHDDVKALKHGGFNSIRVPLHYNLFTLPIEQEPVRGQDTWLDEGLDRLDKVLGWCETEELYAILDLHAAPGGQGIDSGCSDYDVWKPSMWEDDENARKAVSLWGKLAERYANRTIIAGYDLLNEPNWRFGDAGLDVDGCDEVDNALLRDFNDRAIAAIREIDTNHLIFVEGNCWGNNHNGLWPIDDQNVALSFHRYWIENTVHSIQEFLELRDFYGVPLWMGESGESNTTWYRDAIDLLQTHNIGWSWWTYKKMQSATGAFTILPPSGYQELLDYWSNETERPSAEFAFEVMRAVAEAALLKNTNRNQDVIESLTRMPFDCSDAASVLVQGPTRLEAESFCELNGTATEISQDVDGGGNIYWLDSHGWISRPIKVVNAGMYTAKFRVASLTGDGSLELCIGDESNVVGVLDSIPETGGWQEWTYVELPVQLPSGEYSISIRSTSFGWNLSFLELTPIV